MRKFKKAFLVGCATIAFSGTVMSSAACAQPAVKAYSIPSQDLGTALRTFALESGVDVVFSPDLVAGKKSAQLTGSHSPEAALRTLLGGTGLRHSRTGSGFAVTEGNGGAAASGGQDLSGSAVASGQVVDVRTGANLKGALVELEETGQTTSTDDLGSFRFPGLRPGTYTVRISYLGYRDVRETIEVGRGAGARQFAMTGGGDGQEIVVYGQRSARAQALNQERTAPNVSTVLSSDLLGDFTGVTLAESLRRAPGVVFERDPITGDGTNIIIRGLEPDLNTVKLNGIELPEGSGTGRSASLGNILTESISKVTISKTLLPSHDSSGSGGLVEIETKTPLDRPRRYASFTVEGAKRANDFNEEFLASGTVSGRFGTDDQFGLSASVQYRTRKLKRVGYSATLLFGQYLPLEVDGTLMPFGSTNFIDPRTPFPFEPVKPGADEVYPAAISITRAETDTKNLGITLSAAWAVDDNTNLFFDYQRLDQRSTDYSSTLGIRAFEFGYDIENIIALGGEVRHALTWRPSSGNTRALRDPSYIYSPDSSNVSDVFSFRGETTIDRLKLRYIAGYTKGSTKKDTYTLIPNASFAALGAGLLPEVLHPVEGRLMSLFPLREPGNNDFPEPLLTEAGFEALNAATYRFSNATYIRSEGQNKRYVGELSARYEFEPSPLKYIEAGVAIEQSRFSDGLSSIVTYDRNIAAPTTLLSDFGLTFSEASLRDVGVRTSIGQIPRSDIVAFLLTGLPAIAVDCEPFSADNPCPAGTRVIREPSQADPRLLDEFTQEREIAAYLQQAFQIGRLELIGGVRMTRVEIESVNLSGPMLFDENSQFDREFFESNSNLVPEKATQTDFLPRVLANYRFNDNLIFRAGYFSSVARPQIALLSRTPSISLFMQRIFGPAGNQGHFSVQKGNPALKPARTHSFDLSAEYYDDNAGVIKLGGFYKRIDKLLESSIISGEGALEDVRQILPQDPRFQDVLNRPQDYVISISLPVNNTQPAEVWGVEAAVEKQFTFLPGLLSGLGVFANFTYTNSSKTLSRSWSNNPVLDGSGNVVGYELVNIVIPDVRFSGQAKYSGTIGLTYSKYGFDANVAYTRQARRQLNYQDFNLHSFEEAYGTLDARAEYRFRRYGSQFRVYLEGTDLLRGPHNPSIETTRGADDGVTPKYYDSARYFGGRQVRIGIGATF